jgi:ABC-type branched-subunit amino acid transport system substrate-binding protein
MTPPSFTPSSHALLGLAPRPSRAVSIAFVVPMQGPTGIYGPGCLACGELAADDLNGGGGIAGRPVELVAVDAGRAPDEVAAEVARLVELGRVDAIAGWHISAVRQAITARVGGRALYAFAAMHEGGDDTPGVFMIGERPVNQLLPATAWMRANHGVSRWAIVGNDYVFPRVTGSTARAALRGSLSEVVSETYVPLGTRDFAGVLRGLDGGEQDGVIMLLMGQDAVHFNRQFAAAGLSSSLTRLSPAVEENTLLAGGVGANANVFAAAAYFDGRRTTHSARHPQRDPFQHRVAGCQRQEEILPLPVILHVPKRHFQVDESLEPPSGREPLEPAGGALAEHLPGEVDGPPLSRPALPAGPLGDRLPPDLPPTRVMRRGSVALLDQRSSSSCSYPISTVRPS